MTTTKWRNQLREVASASKAKQLSRFFKTGKGQYGEGDIFIGMTVPQNRAISENYYYLTFVEIHELLTDPIHEFRLAALIALVKKYKVSDETTKQEIVKFYTTNYHHYNNWDLVDLSAPYILGDYSLNYDKEHTLIKGMSDSGNLWGERVAIVSTLGLIRGGEFGQTLELCRKFINHKHDLIHKAMGWMLREVGKRDIECLRNFLNEYTPQLPRTTLRYAIERMEKNERELYMKRK
ncbi:MAG: DNA alkylation repair protein [Bacteroidales bacterium]